MKNKSLQVVQWCLIVLASIAVVIDCLFLYFFFTDTSNTFVASFFGKVDQQVEAIPEDELTKESIFEFNYLDNTQNNGTVLTELKLTYFTDAECTDYYATGMQLLAKPQGEVKYVDKTPEEIDSHVDSEFYYYDSYDGVSWKSTDPLSRDKVFFARINEDVFQFKLDKTYEIMGKWLGFIPYVAVRHYYSYPELFMVIASAIETNTYGYGDFYLPLQLTDFFTVSKLSDDGKFYNIEEDADSSALYVNVKVHYDKAGAVYANQSVFNQLKYNKYYDTSGISSSDYHTFNTIYTLTNDDFIVRDSVDFGHLLSIKNELLGYLSKTKKITINVELKLDNTQISGLDFSAFGGLNIHTLMLNSSSEKTFFLLPNAINKLKIIKRDVTISVMMSENAITTGTYEEVVL